MTPTKEQLARLPKWAQQHMAALQRERDTAVKAFREYEDGQTPSKIWCERLTYLDGSGPTLHRNYFQADSIEMEYAGVHLDVNLRNADGIKLCWRPAGSSVTMGPICLIPESYQQVRLSNLMYNEHELKRLRAAKEKDQSERETS